MKHRHSLSQKSKIFASSLKEGATGGAVLNKWDNNIALFTAGKAHKKTAKYPEKQGKIISLFNNVFVEKTLFFPQKYDRI